MRWEKGSETPSFLMLRHRDQGSLRPFSPSQEGVSDTFSHRKRENPVHPKIPSAKIPLAQRMKGFLKGALKGSRTCQPKDPSKPLQDALKNPSKTFREGVEIDDALGVPGLKHQFQGSGAPVAGNVRGKFPQRGFCTL